MPEYRKFEVTSCPLRVQGGEAYCVAVPEGRTECIDDAGIACDGLGHQLIMCEEEPYKPNYPLIIASAAYIIACIVLFIAMIGEGY